ncbi:hypothetical protein [Cedecea neteri]|uniref:hypothetical protein n=1 Tax=Cedecea neteri TaxID=158822 RepID=UPI00289CF072|nr:hypothetical protein [Cedecea neteri]
MKLGKLEPGMVVWDVRKHNMGNTTVKTVSVYQVSIIEVNKDEGWFIFSWNGNKPQKGYEGAAAKLKKNKPITIRSPMGYSRLATREEIKAMKE